MIEKGLLDQSLSKFTMHSNSVPFNAISKANQIVRPRSSSKNWQSKFTVHLSSLEIGCFIYIKVSTNLKGERNCFISSHFGMMAHLYICAVSYEIF